MVVQLQAEIYWTRYWWICMKAACSHSINYYLTTNPVSMLKAWVQVLLGNMWKDSFHEDTTQSLTYGMLIPRLLMSDVKWKDKTYILWYTVSINIKGAKPCKTLDTVKLFKKCKVSLSGTHIFQLIMHVEENSLCPSYCRNQFAKDINVDFKAFQKTSLILW